MIEIQASEILSSLPARISDVVTEWAKRSPNQPALVESSGTWTYSELESVIAETKTWLASLGVRPGDRVLLVCENCRAFVAILLALSSMDAWPALMNARLAANELDAIREHCGARRVIYTTAVSPQAAEHAKRDGAEIRDVGRLGPIGVGRLNENVTPEPVRVRCKKPGRRADLYVRNYRPSQRRHVDPQEFAVRGGNFRKNPRARSR